MHISEVKITPVTGDDKLKAYAIIKFDDCFVIRDLKVIKGHGGFIISMPAKKLKDGSYKDLAHPLNKATRVMIERAVLDEYQKAIRTERVKTGPGHRYSGEA